MKKHALLPVVLLISLIVLGGCTLLPPHQVKEADTDKKEVFAVDETRDEEINTDTVETVVDESENPEPVSGPHKYTVESYEGEVTHPDGETLATYSYSYPVFECNEGDDEKYIETINKMFRENALGGTVVSDEEYGFLVEEYEYAKENGWNWFGPFDYSYNFEIHTDAKGVVSITETWYSYTGGAHGNTEKESHTFDVVNGKELSLSDLLYGTDEEITEAFTREFLKTKEEFFGDPSEIVPEEFPNAQYYVDAEGVTAYFQQYQVGPYASGFVSATITDKEMLKIDFSDVTVE